MLNKLGEIEFWKIIVGVGVFFSLFLLFFVNSDISFSSVKDAETVGLDQKTLYLGEGELCGVANTECRPGLICESEFESSVSGGICVKLNVSGPSDIRPEIPEYDESKETNWDSSDLN